MNLSISNLSFSIGLCCLSPRSLFNPQEIESFNHLREEIASLHVTVPLSMFCLHAGKLNDDLCERVERLKDMIIMFEMKEHRELNEG